MTEAAHDFEGLLRRALAPVEPSEALSERLERALTSIAELAAEELEAWEMAAMRDPRAWPTVARPLAAAAIGTSAGAALVLLRARARGKRRRAQAGDPLDFAGRALRDLADEARRLLGGG